MSIALSPIHHPQNGEEFLFGSDVFRFGETVFELEDSSPLLLAHDFEALRARLDEDGFLFLRGFHPRELALAAEKSVLAEIARRGGTDESGKISQRNESYGFFRDLAVSQSLEMLALTDGEHTFGFYEKLLGGEILTFDKKWLRAMARGGNNGFHYDSVYVGRGTLERLTMWSAISEIPLDRGPLVMALGSHRAEKLKQTYGSMDMDRDLIDAVFSSDPREIVEKYGFPLATAHFAPGDALIFPLLTMHSSAPNRSDFYRISVDTRYQLASLPKDERFFGENASWLGNFYNKDAVYTPMSELKKRWQI